LSAVNRQQCDGCIGKKGPFAQCVSFGPKFFRGACSCCAYNSTGSTCTFHNGNKGSDYAQMTPLEAKAHDERLAQLVDNGLPDITCEMLESAPEPYVARLERMANFERARRAEEALVPTTPKTPKKVTPQKRRFYE
ncbi:hypothetical protein GGR50DRAFT_698999, partial [Xylaria sp. CBS 124048]